MLPDRAVGRIQELKLKRQTPDHYFRIGVRGGGCSGLAYFVDFAEAPDPKDKVFEFGEGAVKVVVDRDSVPMISGAEIDYVEDLMKSGFTIYNPNATSSCVSVRW